MASVRSKVLGSSPGCFLIHLFAFGMRYDRASGKVDLRIRTDICDLTLAGLGIYHKGTQVHACRGVGFVKLPVEWVNAPCVRQYYDIVGVGLCVPGTFRVPGDDDARVGSCPAREEEPWSM